MSPEKTARNYLCCDGCCDLIPTGGKYYVDGNGYLLCIQCAKLGDLKPKGV